MQARAARIEQFGGPEVIRIVDFDVADPGPGEVRVRTTAIGLNYIDTYQRSGLYPIPLPGGMGSELAGVVDAVGEGVTGLAVGDRVATFGVRGAYATAVTAPATAFFRLPDDIDDRTAAAATLKGCTVEFLVERCAKVERGQTVLVHAAAGGVGQLLVGWLKAVGATVIGTVSGDAKAEVARAAGADHILNYKQEDVAARVKEITGGTGVPVVFDGIGMSTWDVSLKSVARRGLIVSFGNAGGAVTGVALGTLAQNGSLFVTRPTAFDYYVTPEERAAGFDRVLTMLRSGAIRPEIHQEFTLDDAADAHRAIEAGETIGATILLP